MSEFVLVIWLTNGQVTSPKIVLGEYPSKEMCLAHAARAMLQINALKFKFKIPALNVWACWDKEMAAQHSVVWPHQPS